MRKRKAAEARHMEEKAGGEKRKVVSAGKGVHIQHSFGYPI